jgi:hypothetical protein
MDGQCISVPFDKQVQGDRLLMAMLLADQIFTISMQIKAHR